MKKNKTIVIAYTLLTALITEALMPMDLKAAQDPDVIYESESDTTETDIEGEEYDTAGADNGSEEYDPGEPEYAGEDYTDEPEYSEYDGWHDIDFDIEQFDPDQVPDSDSDGVSPDMDGDIIVEELPVKYVTPNLPGLRKQTPYNNCWAYSSIALAEINLIGKDPALKDTINLSELQCSYYTYNFVTDPLGGTEGDRNAKAGTKGPLQVGGNLAFSTNVLASWIGASAADAISGNIESAYGGINASSLYAEVSPGSEYAYGHDTYHLTGYYIAEYDINDLDIIKKMITDYGAVSMSIYAKGNASNNYNGYYNSETNGFYGTSSSSNHAVTIVGWDDDFAASAFNTTPAGDGAWLVRNSWSSSDYEEAFNGYFWLSYYNGTLIKQSPKQKVYAFEFDSADNIDNNYQYDGAMYGADSGEMKAANVFTAHANEEGAEKLNAVSFATSGANAAYRIRIYKDLRNGGGPEDGTLAATLNGYTTYAGYHTIPLNEQSFMLKEGERFSVTVELSDTSKGVMTEYTGSSTWYDITAGKDPGTSYIYKNGRWTDFAQGDYARNNWAKYGNFRIKAFTNNINCARFDTCALDARIAYNTIQIERGMKYGQFTALPTPVRRGYAFTGWNTYPDGSGQTVTEESVVETDGNITLYAQWEILKFTVAFDTDGAGELPSQTVTYMLLAEKPDPDPVKEGFDFGGWYSDEAYKNLYDFDSPVSSDLTLHARWGMFLQFDPCGGELTDISYKEIVLGEAYGSLPVPIREGYEFAGWYDSASEDGNPVTSGTVATDESVRRLYARWKEVSPLEISAKAGYVMSGRSLTMTAKREGKKVANTKLAWMAVSADGCGEASVNNKGVLTALTEGRVTVYAYDPLTGLKSAGFSADIYVPVKKSALSHKSVIIPENEEFRAQIFITPSITGAAHATGSAPGVDVADEVTWALKKESDSEYVSVDTDGTIRALKNTSAAVYVTASFIPYGAKKPTVLTCKVRVASKPLSGVALSTSKLSLDVDKTSDISVITTPLIPAGFDTDTVTCIPDNENVSVEYDSGSGICHITGISPGKSVITVRAGAKTAKCTVTVGNRPDHILLNKTGTQSIYINKTLALKGIVYTALNKKYTDQNIVWKTDDPAVAYVTPSGKVVGISAGNTVITATLASDPEIRASCTVQVIAR